MRSFIRKRFLPTSGTPFPHITDAIKKAKGTDTGRINSHRSNGADLLITADCVPFAYGNFHRGLLKGKILLVGCPKLDDAGFYQDKITEILKNNDIKSLTIAHMEVPCCFGIVKLVNDALEASGKDIPIDDITIKVNGDILEKEKV